MSESIDFNVSAISDGVKKTLDNNVVKAVIILTVIFYGAFIAPSLPPKVLRIFENTWLRLLIIGCVVYLATKNYVISLAVAVFFLFTTNILRCRSLKAQVGDYVKDIPYFGKGKRSVNPTTDSDIVSMDIASVTDADGMDYELPDDAGYGLDPTSQIEGQVYEDLTNAPDAPSGSAPIGAYDGDKDYYPISM